MAKTRRNKDEIAADKIIKQTLNELGNLIYEEAIKITRVDTSSLQRSINYSVKPDTTLTFFQNSYGKFVRPVGEETGEKDALLITIKELLPAGIKVVKKDLTESILFPYKNRK